MIIPKIKKIQEKHRWFEYDLIFPDRDGGYHALKLFHLFSPGVKAFSGVDSNIVFHLVDFKNNGEYRLSVTEDQIVINYCSYEGLRNAIATLSGLTENGKIKCVEISDYPDHGFRSCLLNLARGYIEIDKLKEHLVRLAKLKFNYVHLHLMDRQSYILQSDVVPNPDHHRQYTKEECKEIVEFCDLLSFDAIPEIEFPAHAVNLLKAVPDLGCDIIDMKKAREKVEEAKNSRKEFYIHTEKQISSWAVCIGKETTYKIYEDIIDEIAEIFDSEYIHIGGDEIAFYDLAAFPNRDNCYECKTDGKLSFRSVVHLSSRNQAYP